VTADVYVVLVAVTQKRCVPLVQLASELQPAAVQKPPEQMVEGGVGHSMSAEQAIWQAPALHCARGLPVDWTQSAAVVHPDFLQRLVVVSQVLPDAQSMSFVHLK
jgi:hypothetical protein